jgi:hypothetical protein
MSKPQRTLPSLADIKNAVKEVARESDIPTVTFPSAQSAQPATGAGHPGSASAEATDTAANIRPLQPAHATQARKARGPKAAQVRRFSVDLPVYLIEAIADKAHDKKRKKRTIVLDAFRSAGFTVKDIDIEESKHGE